MPFLSSDEREKDWGVGICSEISTVYLLSLAMLK